MDDGPLPANAAEHLLSTSVGRLNRLRAAVLGGNDGITSVAGLVVGVAAATSDTKALLLAGISGLVAGALSMGGGEYTSVRAQRDSHDALIHRQVVELSESPVAELDELTHLYVEKGLPLHLAREVAKELTQRDALAAHADVELRIDLEDLVSPWEASAVSALSFFAGGAISLLAIWLPPQSIRIPICVIAVLFGLAVAGFIGAHLGGAPKGRATIRNALVGGATMAITFALGSIGHSVL
jgi:VIT1/CCC1 family predicted Fe2+/Mn2+ transporter